MNKNLNILISFTFILEKQRTTFNKLTFSHRTLFHDDVYWKYCPFRC